MNERVEWITACAEKPQSSADKKSCQETDRGPSVPIDGLPVHNFPARGEVGQADRGKDGAQNRIPGCDGFPGESGERLEREPEEERERRIYRGRTVAMLRRYMRYSIEVGRLPSLLGREFFRSKVTSYIVVTFEDRVIFVHDMERCLEKLDEFSRQLIGRHILQEYDQFETGRLLGCTERTVRTYVPIALDVLVDILLEVGLLEPLGGK